jgi:2-desacetyl-2-hydroxyethyl bacteriochlorophyllide A dehydrogenase
MTSTFRSARLHGVEDLRLERLPRPEPSTGEVLVAVEACGICPTDVRKFHVGVNDGQYPFNPGHEWVGRVIEAGDRAGAELVDRRVYGDTYGGYAELAVLPLQAYGWSHGPLPLPDDLPLHRAVFVEPLADCLHALLDQGAVGVESRVVIVGAGQMGLQMVAVAATFAAHVVAVDPLAERRALARRMGAHEVVDPSETPLVDRLGAASRDVVVLTLARSASVEALLPLLNVGGRLVLFAGFGNEGRATVDLNDVHYRELTIIGSEWIGAPPRQRLERYQQARDLLVDGGRFALERLVTDVCDLDGLHDAFDAVGAHRSLKTVLEMTP